MLIRLIYPIDCGNCWENTSMDTIGPSDIRSKIIKYKAYTWLI